MGWLTAEMGEVGYKLGGAGRADYTGCISHIRAGVCILRAMGSLRKVLSREAM